MPSGQSDHRLGKIIILAVLMLSAAMTTHAVTLIGTNPAASQDARIMGIETDPFSASEIGLAGFGSLAGIDIQPGTGIWFATSGFGTVSQFGFEHYDGGRLYTINPATGAATLVGATGFAGIPGLSFDDTTGILYGSASLGENVFANPNIGDRLVTINTITGAATLVGVYGDLGADHIRGMDSLAINPLTGTLYGITNNLFDSSADDFFQIDKLTGAATRLGFLREAGTSNYPAQPISGLDFDSTGNLYGSLGGNDGRIVSINLATLEYTYLGDARPGSTASGSFNSMSSIAVMPEPSRTMFLGMALMALLMRRRR